MESRQAELFRVLGVESRIKILEFLKQNGPTGVKEISEYLGITPSAVSQHLKILKHAGLVRNQRKGYWIPYEVAADALEECRELLFRVCSCGCKGRCHAAAGEPLGGEQELELLRQYEQALVSELEQVRARMEGLKE